MAMGLARIILYGYDADVGSWKSRVSYNRVRNHANILLSALATFRATNGTEGRPIIFVAHSLGGLVCMDVSQPLIPICIHTKMRLC